MRTINHLIIAGLIATGAAAVLPNLNPASADVLPAAARYYPLIGHWKGKGQLSEAGKKPLKLSLDIVCSKAAGGWAVRCDMTAKNGKLVMREADLMAVDPVTGKEHWYAVSNMGETHDHITEWTSAKEMKARYSWVQDGKKMEENIAVQLPGKKALEFRSVVTADGKEASVFTGMLRR